MPIIFFIIEYSLIEQIFHFFPEHIIDFIVLYGNRSGKDKDIFIKLNTISEYNNIVYKYLDITYVGKRDFKIMLENADPLITEPILAGNTIFGRSIKKYKDDLLNKEINDSIIEYLIRQSRKFYLLAESHMFSNYTKEAFVALSFSISYIYYSIYYEKNRRIILFTDLQKKFPESLLTESMEIIKDKGKMDFERLEYLFRNTEQKIEEFR